MVDLYEFTSKFLLSLSAKVIISIRYKYKKIYILLREIKERVYYYSVFSKNKQIKAWYKEQKKLFIKIYKKQKNQYINTENNT